MTQALHSTLRIVFLHIPKTAGQSVHSELIRLVPDDAVSPVRVHTQVRAGAPQMPEGYRLYSGHLDWDRLGDVPAPKFVFTILRDPLERIASFYFYLLAKAKTLTPEDLAQPHHTGMRMISTQTAEEYFFGGDSAWKRFIHDHYDNVQATYLATRRMRGWAEIKDMPQDDVLARALAHADTIDGIYTTKTLARLEDDLERATGMRPKITDKRVNLGPANLAPVNVGRATTTDRWPALAALLSETAQSKLRSFGELDARLLDRLGPRL